MHGYPRGARARPRDIFTRDLDLPRGRERERDRARVYDIDGSEGRMLATVGSFCVVGERDLTARDGMTCRTTRDTCASHGLTSRFAFCGIVALR